MSRRVRERERKKQVQCTGSRIAQLLKVKRNWFERLFIVAQKSRAGVFPLVFQESLPIVIPIQPLNVGDKGVAKIKWKHTLATKASERRLKRINTYCYDLTRRNKMTGGRGWGYQNLHFSSEESKSKILRGYWGGQLTPELLFKLRGWAYGLITQSEDDSVSKDYQIRKRWNGVMGRGQVYLRWAWPCPRRMFISELLSEVAKNIALPLI